MGLVRSCFHQKMHRVIIGDRGSLFVLPKIEGASVHPQRLYRRRQRRGSCVVVFVVLVAEACAAPQDSPRSKVIPVEPQTVQSQAWPRENGVDRDEQLRPAVTHMTTRDGIYAYPGLICAYPKIAVDPDSDEAWKAAERFAELLSKEYGLSCGGTIGVKPPLPSTPRGKSTAVEGDNPAKGPQVYVSCDVREGHEQLWIEILRSDPRLDDCDACPAVSASIADQVDLPAFLSPSVMQHATVTGALERVMISATSIVRRFYGDRGSVSETGSSPAHRRFVVTGLRGVVVPSSSSWERLEIDLIATPTDRSILLYAVIDVYDASQLGPDPPATNRYVDMAPSHQKDLSDHLGELMVVLKGALTKETP